MILRGEAFPGASVTLMEIDVFSSLPDDVIKVLSNQCQWRRYRARQPVLSYQDTACEAFFVKSGRVRITYFSALGREIALGDVGQGGMFGEISALDGRPRSADVVALTDTLIAVMPGVVFREMLHQHASVAEAVLLHLAALVRSTTERIYELSTLPVPYRVQAEILRLGRQNTDGPNRAVIVPAPKHNEIASRVSANREAVTREFGALRQAGLLQHLDHALVIPDMDRLRRHFSRGLGAQPNG
jgi:CRP/FNR family cyclic AMP-dependent transcriptional regulator